MKPLVIFCLLLAALFASTFFLVAGNIDFEEILKNAHAAANARPLWTGSVVAAILFADLFVAVPTLTLTMLSGHFLGFFVGGSFAVVGMMAAGVVGYIMGRRFGTGFLKYLCRDPIKLQEARELFVQRGPYVLLLCRALPILAEVSCCLAGATQMPFKRFICFYAAGTIPYALIAAFAGSKSTLADPRPAIFVVILLSFGLWLSWFLLARHWRRTRHTVEVTKESQQVTHRVV